MSKSLELQAMAQHNYQCCLDEYKLILYRTQGFFRKSIVTGPFRSRTVFDADLFNKFVAWGVWPGYMLDGIMDLCAPPDVYVDAPDLDYW